MISIDGVGVFLGLDVGKHAHHGHGLTPAGKTVFDKPLPNSEPKLRAVFDKLQAKFGTVLLVVDQPASIGALPLTVARHAGCQVACLPGLAMRRIADLYPGEAKTDAKGRRGHRGRRPHHAPHPAHPRTRRRGHRRADHARRLRPGPRRRGQPHLQPHPRPAHPVPPPAWNASSAHAWTTRPSPGFSSVTDPPPLCARPAAAGWSKSSAREPRAWPNGWSTTSSPRSTSRPSPTRAPAPST
ncbi:hypothetical protein B1H29_35955 [Streptomyces pactum]|uniref:Transposase IS110-like N-terminal domain-containing protein n=1 Tax=Streptomyces pactum TaxID=68249 RepID=A0A1S6JIF2_9ACTN|nr:hypothetical protein B1H29_35955 [Streptomyces pactum]